MRFIEQKINGLKKRLRLLSYGITYLRDTGFTMPSILRINGSKKKIGFIDTGNSGFMYEFTEICINDSYRLAELKKRLGSVKVIVDIGANQGLFIVAARQHFAKASISCYEPNLALRPVLGANAAVLDAAVYYEAVTKEDCKMELQLGASDLHTTVRPDNAGDTTGRAFTTVIERAGGKIDILKMDCEGGEWDLLSDTASWANIRSVTMEYHLWAKTGSTVEKVQTILKELGFEIISNDCISDKFGLITGVRETGKP